MKKTIIIIVVGILLVSSCKTKKKIVVDENIELIKSIETYVTGIDEALIEQGKLKKEGLSENKTDIILVDITEEEFFYKKDNLLKILITSHLAGTFKEVKSFYYNGGSLVYIEIEQFVSLKDRPKEHFLRKIFFSKDAVIRDLGKTNTEISSLELLDLARLKFSQKHDGSS